MTTSRRSLLPASSNILRNLRMSRIAHPDSPRKRDLRDITRDSPAITRHLGLDVVCLSSILERWTTEGGQNQELPGGGDAVDTFGPRRFFHNLAIICTAGTEIDPKANKVFAVTGGVRLQNTVIEDIVFAFNEPIVTVGNTAEASEPRTTRIIPTAALGKALVHNWETSSL